MTSHDPAAALSGAVVLGAGSFGSVYYIDERTACKVEKRGARATLGIEYRVLQHLRGCSHVPRVYGLFADADGGTRRLTMERLGMSLEALFKRDGAFSAPQARVALEGAITALEQIHDRGIVHRDVSPANLAVSLPSPRSVVKLIDFGLSKSFREPSGAHTRRQSGRGIVGTLRYCGCDAHMGYGACRRSDLQSLAFTLRYLCDGTLPWIGVGGGKGRREEAKRRKAVWRLKRGMAWDDCAASTRELWRHSCALSWDERPDYERLRRLCR